MTLAFVAPGNMRRRYAINISSRGVVCAVEGVVQHKRAVGAIRTVIQAISDLARGPNYFFHILISGVLPRQNMHELHSN